MVGRLLTCLLYFCFTSIWGIEVNGLQTGHWIKAESPYVITKRNVVVPGGGRLEIEPGVVVKFDGYYGIEVRGTLIANGRPQQSIIFTSNKDPAFARLQSPEEKGNGASPFDWSHLMFIDNEYGEMENCVIRYSFEGIKTHHAQLKLINVVFQQIAGDFIDINGYSILLKDGKKIYFSEDDGVNPDSRNTHPTQDNDYLKEFNKVKSAWWVWTLVGGALLLTGVGVFILIGSDNEPSIGGVPTG